VYKIGLNFLSIPWSQRLLLLVALLPWAFLCPLLSAGTVTNDYHWRVWTTDEGLPHNSLTSITQDANGYLWFASLGGLVRFDGVNFKKTDLPRPYRPRGYNIRLLTKDRDGSLLFEPTGQQILRWQDGRLEQHPITPALEGRQVRELFPAPDGALWVGFPDGRLGRWTPGGMQWFDTAVDASLPRERATFAIDAKGELWISFNDFFGVYREGKLVPSTLAIHNPQLISPDPNGNIWICEADRLSILQGDQLTVLADEVPWEQATAELRHLSISRSGTAWISAGRLGLWCWSEGTLRQVEIPFPIVNYATEDQEGSIWVSSDGNGLGQLRPKHYTRYDRTAGLRQQVSNAVLCRDDGTTWLANNRGGVALVEGEKATPLDTSADGDPLLASTLCFDLDGSLWFAGRDGLYRSAPPYTTAERLPSPGRDITLLHTARDGRIWFASFAGQFGYFEEGAPVFMTEQDGYHGQSLRSLAETSRGEIWAGSYTGDLFHYHAGKLDYQNIGRPVHSLYADAEGRLWMATVEGLMVQMEDNFVLLTEAEGLADSLIALIAEDHHGNMWFGALSGLYYIKKEALLAVAAGEREQVVSYSVGKDQGLSGMTFLINYFPSVQTGTDGRLWFATSDGVIAIDPDTTLATPATPVVYVDDVQVNGQPQNIAAGKISVLPGQQRIEVEFSIPNFSDPRNVIVRHRLEGADPEWIETGADRSISYSGLAPGSYRLLVAAGIGPDSWASEPAVVFLEVLPAWWQTLWFRLGGALAAALLLIFIVRKWSQYHLRQRLQRLERDQALERERARIARDLHDDLGGRLTALQLLAARLGKLSGRERDSGLNQLAERARRLNSDVHSIVWLITPRDSSLRNLVEFLRRYTLELFKNTPIECTVDDPSRIPAHPISPDVQHNVFFAAKEALTNILKHAHATDVAVNFGVDNGTFYCAIRDNDNGIPADAITVNLGNGLANMKTRMHEIKGDLQCSTPSTGGTLIQLRLPLPHP